MPRPAELSKARQRAVERGLAFLERLAGRRGGLQQFGSGLLYCCGFWSATTPDTSLKTRTLLLTKAAFHEWCVQFQEGLYDGSAASITAAVQTLDAVARTGRRYPSLQRQLLELARHHSAIDFYGFDPRREPPPKDLPASCQCGAENERHTRHCFNCGEKLTAMPAIRAWYLCFISAYCGQRYGVKLGSTYEDAMKWLPQMRRYKSPRQGWNQFHDSVYAITHLVYTLNDYGRFLLEPQWLRPEYEFLQKHWSAAIEADDPDMTGEFLDSLRAFGLTEETPAIRYAMEYLIESQNEDGSWGLREGKIDYRRFHATWAALDGLREFKWKATGLSFPKMMPMVKRWEKA